MNCFRPIDRKKANIQLLPDIVFDEKKEVWNLVPKASKFIDADGIEQDIIEYQPVKVNEYKIADYINSFADEIGIQNILKRLAITGDRSLLNQTGRQGLCPDGGIEPLQDYSNVPSSKTEAFNIVAAGVAAYDSLPQEIKEKMSMAQFAESFGQEQFDAYVKKITEAYNAQHEQGGNE